MPKKKWRYVYTGIGKLLHTGIELADKVSLCEKVSRMSVFFGKKSFGGYVALQKRVLSMMKSSPYEKYQLLSEQYPQLFQRVFKTMIAH